MDLLGWESIYREDKLESFTSVPDCWISEEVSVGCVRLLSVAEIHRRLLSDGITGKYPIVREYAAKERRRAFGWDGSDEDSCVSACDSVMVRSDHSGQPSRDPKFCQDVRVACDNRGMSQRAAAVRFKVTRKTIKGILEDSGPAPDLGERFKRGSILDPRTWFIDEILDSDASAPRKQRHSAKWIFERLHDEQDYKRGLIIVRNV